MEDFSQHKSCVICLKAVAKSSFGRSCVALDKPCPGVYPSGKGCLQRDFPYGASNQAADSFRTWPWDVNQGLEGLRACKWPCWWELPAPQWAGAPTNHTHLSWLLFPKRSAFAMWPPQETCTHSVVCTHLKVSCPELNLHSFKVCH